MSGWSPTDATREEAAGSGFRVHGQLEAALQWADNTNSLVVLAAPVTAFDGLLRKITRYSPQALVTDVGGVKSPVAQQVSVIAPLTKYVGGHPMAGSAQSGFGAGSADLFSGSAWVTCLDAATPLDAWDAVTALAITVGSRVVPCTAADHDRAVARVSQLPHLLALALAQVGALGGPLALSLAAGSFADGTRVASTRPELIRAMCETNREPLVDAFDDALGILGVARASLASTGSLQKATEGGHLARLVYERRHDGFTDVEWVEPSIDQLLALGTAGGQVTDIRREELVRTVVGRAPAGLTTAQGI